MGNTRSIDGARIRGVVATTVAIIAVGGLAGCTTGQAGEAPSPTIAITTGDLPNQDVIALPGERDALVAAAVEQLPEIVEDALERSGVPGAAVAVVSEDEVVYTGAFGVRDVETEEPVDEDTVFQIASLSKPLSATVVAKLITDSDGALSWTSPVSQFLTDFSMNDPYVTEHGTIGDFFSHRTGLPTGGGDDLEDIGYDRDYILDHLGMIPLDAFRTSYHYSNYGLTTGAVAAAASAGLEWEAAERELLFEPLGMTSTSSSHDDFLAAENRATLHAKVDGEFQPLYDRDPDPQAPAGGVSSTVGDLATWMRLVLAGGELDGEPYIDGEALVAATTAQTISSHARDVTERPSHYAFGFNAGPTVSGRESINHSGAFSLGAATVGTMIPELDLGIVVLSNGGPVGMPEAVTAQFLDLVQYGAVTRDWVDDMAGFFAPYSHPAGDLAEEQPPASPAAPGSLTDYAGTYTNPYFGDLVVSVEGDRLVGALGPEAGYVFDLDPWDGDTFSFVPTGENAPAGSLSSASFVRDGSGVASVTLAYFDASGLGTWQRTG